MWQAIQIKPTKKPVEAGYVNVFFLKLYLLCYRCKISYKYKLSVLSIRRFHHNKSSDLYIYIYIKNNHLIEILFVEMNFVENDFIHSFKIIFIYLGQNFCIYIC